MGNRITELDELENWHGNLRSWHVYVCMCVVKALEGLVGTKSVSAGSLCVPAAGCGGY